MLMQQYHLIRILGQICYILVVKGFHCQSRRTPDTFTHQIFSSGKNAKKRSLSAFRVNDFPFIL